MRVKLSLKTISSKVLFLDCSLISINSNDIFIKELPTNSFTIRELNSMANTSGIIIEFLGRSNEIIRLSIPKGYCSVNFMPTNEDRIKYLTNEVDILSAELNHLINGNN